MIFLSLLITSFVLGSAEDADSLTPFTKSFCFMQWELAAALVLGVVFVIFLFQGFSEIICDFAVRDRKLHTYFWVSSSDAVNSSDRFM